MGNICLNIMYSIYMLVSNVRQDIENRFQQFCIIPKHKSDLFKLGLIHTHM